MIPGDDSNDGGKSAAGGDAIGQHLPHSTFLAGAGEAHRACVHAAGQDSTPTVRAGHPSSTPPVPSSYMVEQARLTSMRRRKPTPAGSLEEVKIR
ncbi:hypothetical protein SH611_20755 [Geminicoccaceae bacterium 1502E]|nr:hypothetical protein [Geminicoccaceae bacterium 1502E]